MKRQKENREKHNLMIFWKTRERDSTSCTVRERGNQNAFKNRIQDTVRGNWIAVWKARERNSTSCTVRKRDNQNAFKNPLQAGWTYIETLIVIGIIVILMAVVAVTATGSLQKARVAAAKTQIDSFCTALEAYCIDCGFYPTQSQGLEALRKKPSTSPVSDYWSGPYISKNVPKDPWGNEYVYIVPSPEGDSYGIICYGADGMEGGVGINADLTSWGE